MYMVYSGIQKYPERAKWPNASGSTITENCILVTQGPFDEYLFIKALYTKRQVFTLFRNKIN